MVFNRINQFHILSLIDIVIKMGFFAFCTKLSSILEQSASWKNEFISTKIALKVSFVLTYAGPSYLNKPDVSQQSHFTNILSSCFLCMCTSCDVTFVHVTTSVRRCVYTWLSLTLFFLRHKNGEPNCSLHQVHVHFYLLHANITCSECVRLLRSSWTLCHQCTFSTHSSQPWIIV